MAPRDRDAVLDAYDKYQLNMDAIEKLKPLLKNVTCIVFSAPWCGDCKRATPVLMHLVKQTDLDVRVFGSIKTAPLDPDHQWKIPPSPPEIEDWKVTHIPWIVFFDNDGNELGKIIEKPEFRETLEEETLYVLTK